MKGNGTWWAAICLLALVSLTWQRLASAGDRSEAAGAGDASHRPADLSRYKRAASVPIDSGNPEFGSARRPYPGAGRPTITAATFEPGIILEISPDPEKLRATEITLEDLREACFYRRFAPDDRSVEILERNAATTADFTVIKTRPKRTIDLASVAAIRSMKLQTRTILYRFYDGGGLRITPEVDKIAPYLITIDDFELLLQSCGGIIFKPAALADPANAGWSGFFMMNELTLETPEKYLVLNGLRILDRRLPHYYVKYDAQGRAFWPVKLDGAVASDPSFVQKSIGVPLNTVARVEVVPVRTLHGVVVDPFMANPEEDFIVRSAAILEAVQEQVKDDPILKPLVRGRRIPYPPPVRVLGYLNRGSIRVDAETPDVFRDPYRREDDTVSIHGWLRLGFDESYVWDPRWCATHLIPPAGDWGGETGLAVQGTKGGVYVGTLTHDPRAHRRLVDLVIAESAKRGWTLKPGPHSSLDSRNSDPAGPVPPALPPGVKCSVTPR